jgi:hypothetical protein
LSEAKQHVSSIPGGWRKFPYTLKDCLSYLSEPKLEKELMEWLQKKKEFGGVGKQNLRPYIKTLLDLSFIVEKPDTVYKTFQLTKLAEQYIRSADEKDFLFNILESKFEGLKEIIEVLKNKGELQKKAIHEHLMRVLGKSWKRDTQTQRRLEMLKAVDKVRSLKNKVYCLYPSDYISQIAYVEREYDDDFAVQVQKRLNSNYGIEVKLVMDKQSAWLKFPSDSMMYVSGRNRDKKKLGNSLTFNLPLKVCEKLKTEPKHYYAIVFEELNTTFILPGSKIPSIFAGLPTKRAQGSAKWQFRIWKEKNGTHKLKLSGEEMTTHNIQGYLNNWNQIYDLREKSKQEILTPSEYDSEEIVDKPYERIAMSQLTFSSSIDAVRTRIDSHESAEYCLLELGNKLNFHTYTPDASMKFNDKILREVATIKEIANEVNNDKDIKNIDVI